MEDAAGFDAYFLKGSNEIFWAGLVSHEHGLGVTAILIRVILTRFNMQFGPLSGQ